MSSLLPWELTLTDGDSRIVLLVPNFRPCVRGDHSAIRCTDFDDGGESRITTVARPFYLFTVGLNNEVVAPSISAALYLFSLWIHQGQHVKAAALVCRCASTMPYSAEEIWAASLIGTTAADTTPAASACRLAMFEALQQNRTHITWNVLADAWRFLQGHLRVDAGCLLDPYTERVALDGVVDRPVAPHGLHRRFPAVGEGSE